MKPGRLIDRVVAQARVRREVCTPRGHRSADGAREAVTIAGRRASALVCADCQARYDVTWETES